MIDSTDEELISRIMKGKDYYWGSEENKDKAIPTIRSKNLSLETSFLSPTHSCLSHREEIDRF